nr:MAG TPA: hypothetical protein [Caudoviricetes sp.]DAN25716.1 MAG TPA: hypothetical protein [Bacteriophage sp.]
MICRQAGKALDYLGKSNNSPWRNALAIDLRSL